MPKKQPVTPRIAGPVDIGGTRFPLSKNVTLDFVQGMHRLVFGDDSFFVILYGALNACGLIGTEHNGIAVCWENQGKVVLQDHYRDSSYMKASVRQQQEYAAICAMDRAQFKAFINDHPAVQYKIMISKPKPIARSRVHKLVAGLSGNKYHAVTDKAAFFRALVKFLCNHCDWDQFTPLIYNGLHRHLGHIAHYDRGNFYAEWFADADSRVRFFERHSRDMVYIDWDDVTNALAKWINSPEGQGVFAHYWNEKIKAEAANRKAVDHGSKETVGLSGNKTTETGATEGSGHRG